MNLVVRDAFWQILGRFISALAWFMVVKLITPYFGPLRYGDYSTILKYFAIWSALADFGVYVVALNRLGKIKDKVKQELMYHKFLWVRFVMVAVVYGIAFLAAYLIPAYSGNPFIVWGLLFGMIFSALFMSAGIIQIPLQLNWKMKDVSIALIRARVVQISILCLWIFVLFTDVDFSTSSKYTIWAFLFVLFSVLASGLAQFIYVLYKGGKFLKFKIDFDLTFIKNIIKTNWRYGFSYYLSSFHTLIVLIMFSIYYPTADGWTFVGTWALALALIEILLIIPSALWNSMIHKISDSTMLEKRKSFGFFMSFIVWIGLAVMYNFTFFSTDIIQIIAGSDYLTTASQIWSDFILPFLSFVLFLSFIKQVFNYLFVSTDNQNYLFNINLVGVIIGTIAGLYLIPIYNIKWGIITQVLLEILFVLGALFIAYRKKVLPIIKYKFIWLFSLIFTVLTLISWQFDLIWNMKNMLSNISLTGNYYIFNLIIIIFSVNLVYILVSWPYLKKVLKSL